MGHLRFVWYTIRVFTVNCDCAVDSISVIFFLLPKDPVDSTYLKLLFKFSLFDIFHILVRCSVVSVPHTGFDHCP